MRNEIRNHTNVTREQIKEKMRAERTAEEEEIIKK